MALYEEILTDTFERIAKAAKCSVSAKELVELRCYQALCQIQEILKDDQLEDEACFLRIEEIVRVYESLGSDAGGRHDFG